MSFPSYHPSELVKVDMLLNGDQVDALSFIAHKDKAYGRARKLCEKLKENIPGSCSRSRCRPRSAARSSRARPSRPCARTCSPSAMAATSRARKKLLEKQKEGKKKMRQLGKGRVLDE